jgi:hypothetical protein
VDCGAYQVTRGAQEKLEIHELTDKFLMCRMLGHSWDDNPNGEVDSEYFRHSKGALALRCTRCRTERYDYLDNSMQVFQRYYKYPKRYTTIPGYTRPDVRAEMLSRSLLIRGRRNGKR